MCGAGTFWDGFAVCCTDARPPSAQFDAFFSRVTGGSITAVGLTDVVRALSHCLQLEEIK